MKTLCISVLNKVALSSARNKIVCGNSDYQIKFTFDSEWDGFVTKTARFIWNGEYVDVVFTGDVCTAPIITGTDKVSVGVYAGNLSTTTPAVIEAERSILCEDGLPNKPDDADDYYAKIVKLLEEGAISGGGGSIDAAELNEMLDDVMPLGVSFAVVNDYGTILHTYIFEEGMTWGEFINSDYNVREGEAGHITDMFGGDIAYTHVDDGAGTWYEFLGETELTYLSAYELIKAGVTYVAWT